jgi:type II restriction/modification system DNA methylase subunit YeeA
LCCYWFEKARRLIEERKCERAGLLATQAIRGGLNREVLNRIKKTGDIFWAQSDRDWILDGANVHVSMVVFDDGRELTRTLDGRTATKINANLTATADITEAERLRENGGLGYIADVKAGRFDLQEAEATPLLQESNPNGRPNSDVLVPWVNGQDILQRWHGFWIIDFGSDLALATATRYEAPFELARLRVLPDRSKVKRRRYRELWWLHAEPCTAMRKKVSPLARFIVTPTVAKHRVFAWLGPPTLPDHQLVVIARSDDYFFGVLHSRIHEVWARAQGTQVRERESGFRYTPTTCLETFPFPLPPGSERTDALRVQAIAAAAKELDELRRNWLNPPDWTREEVLEFPGSVDGPWARYVHDPDARGIGIVRYPRIAAKDAESAVKLKERTLTNLYNQRPTWLALAHEKLDTAVFAAYGWDPSISDEHLLAALLEQNLRRAREAPSREAPGVPP